MSSDALSAEKIPTKHGQNLINTIKLRIGHEFPAFIMVLYSFDTTILHSKLLLYYWRYYYLLIVVL